MFYDMSKLSAATCDRKTSTSTTYDRLTSAQPPIDDLSHSEPKKASCGHQIHPAYTSTYDHSGCPYCRLMRNILDLAYIESKINNVYGGVGPWLQRIRDSPSEQGKFDDYTFFRLCVRGGSCSRPEDADLDHDGKDRSHRHAKKRLHNLLDELQDLAEQEAEWAEFQITSSTESSQQMDVLCMPFSATAALKYHHSKEQDGSTGYLETDNAEFARNRGREWEISLHPNYPQDPSERDDAHQFFRTTPEQHAFIEASTLPLTDPREYVAIPRHKKRHVDARVTFSPKIYVRTDADIDVLRAQVVASSKVARKQSFDVRPLNKGPGREQWLYRPGTIHYKLGQWTASRGNVIVDTSGCAFGGDHDAWEEYVRALEKEGRGDDVVSLDLEVVFDAIVCFVIVWWFLFLWCMVAGHRRVARVLSR
jgi:hypothetical protein